MSRSAKWEYLKAVHGRYREAPRVAKGRILDEFCETTDYHRKYALRLLNGPPPLARAAPAPAPPGDVQPGRDPGVDGDLGGRGLPLVRAVEGPDPPLAAVGAAAVAAVGDGVPAAPGHQPRQIDRRLGPAKRQLKTRRSGRTKPGTLLKHHRGKCLRIRVGSRRRGPGKRGSPLSPAPCTPG